MPTSGAWKGACGKSPRYRCHLGCIVLKMGASDIVVDRTDREGKSALDLARQRGNEDVAAALELWAAKVPRLTEKES